MCEVKVITNKEQYLFYLNETSELIKKAPKLGTPESDKLQLLAVVIEDYESRNYSIELPNPIDAILFRMNEMDLKQADLVSCFGTRSCASAVLNKKRSLTPQMIRALTHKLKIPTETLVGISLDYYRYLP